MERRSKYKSGIERSAYSMLTLRLNDLTDCFQPDGKLGKNKNVKSGFLAHNEYVSNNVNCLKLRYLLKVAM